MAGFKNPCVSETDIQHIPNFGGNLWYVNADNGNDSNTGKKPLQAFATIGAGISSCSAGDAITIMAGTYTETGLDLNKNNVELWCEIGVIIDPASGTGLTISGDYCSLKGQATISQAADETGLLLSGDGILTNDLLILGTASTNGVQVTGDLCDLFNVKTAGIKATGKNFDIQGDKTTIKKCGCSGSTTSYGFHVSGSTGLFEDCFSVGNQTAGYYFDSGVTEWTIKECTSGAGDGHWVDVDDAQMWDGFDFDDEKYATTDFSVVGGAGGSQNLYKVTGAVQIYGLRCHVTTQLNADVDNVKYTMWDGTASTDITDNVDSASAPVGSLFVRETKAADSMVLYSSAAAELMEEVDLKKAVFGINAKNGADTYIRITWSGTGATGVLHHHIVWEPLNNNGFVSVV